MSINYNQKTLLMGLLGGSIVTLLVWSKYKKQLKEMMRKKKYHPSFEPVNQNKKRLVEGCGVLSDMKEKAHDTANERIIISDREHLKKKLAHMRKEGLQELQILSDYDQTITAFGCQNEQEISTFGVINKSKRVSQKYLDDMNALYQHYSPYEKDVSIDKETLMKIVTEWYSKTAECFRNEHMTKELLLEAIHDSGVALRYNFKQFVNALQHINLPFYVISGGVSPIIMSCLESVVCTKKFSNFFLFSQEGYFDENGVLVDLQMNVNTCSKHEKVNSKEFNLRKNTLIFGDLNHDIYMKNELDGENVISVLFLRDKMKDQIESLKEYWDIILTGNGSFITHQALINYIAGAEYENLKMEGEAKEIYTNSSQYSELRDILSN
ncbi:hypothetical protein ABPG74_011370 [Tetrahymena malaccensis]